MYCGTSLAVLLKVIKPQQLFVDNYTPDREGVIIKSCYVFDNTSPTNYGKSTILEKLKESLEIPTDHNQIKIQKNISFKKGRKISDKTFMNDDIEDHPIRHIMYHPLEKTSNYETFLKRIGKVYNSLLNGTSYL